MQKGVTGPVELHKRMYPFYFVLTALVLYLVFFLIPGFMGILYSFTNWSSFSTTVDFVGIRNFLEIFSLQNGYLSEVRNTVLFTLYTVVLKTCLGLVFALLFNRGLRLKSMHRLIIFMPSIIPTLVVGLVFTSILNPTTGLLNTFLRWIGLGAFAQQWLTNPHVALGSVIGVDTWKGVGYITVILLAGLQSISTEYYEAARIDGANAWQELSYITLPQLMPALTVTTVFNVLYGLGVFDIVYVLTNGGPGNATNVMNTTIFDQFSLGNYGLGTALSTVMFFVMVVIGFFIVRFMRTEQ